MKKTPVGALIFTVALSTAACERPPMEHTEIGWRGIGLLEIENPRMRAADSTAVAEAMPPEFPPFGGSDDAAPPGTWQNVQVLGNLSELEFNRTMAAITQWVAPEQGCTYCHAVDAATGAVNMASDDIYTKVASREMFRMIKEINGQWSSHVGDAGVTCYTCHAGQPVPQNIWFYEDDMSWMRHLLDRDDARVQSSWALASEGENDVSIPETVETYELMIHVSNSLGVSCTFCHQTSRWADWEESPPARTKALRGIRMVRQANMNHLVPLQDVWPPERLGPLGDGPKVECATCHQGANLPLYGLLNADGWPALHLPAAQNPPAATGAEGSLGAGGGL